MPIGRQFGPSSVSYGDAVYRSGQNQERYRRATENLSGSASNADAKYKLGMLKLEQEKFAFEKPLTQKASDLAEIETWLEKSIAYFQARAQAAQQRLAGQAEIIQGGRMQVGEYPGVSGGVSSQGSQGGGVSSSASGKSVRYAGTASGPIAIPESFSSGDRAYQGNPYLSQYSPTITSFSDADMWLSQANARERQREEMATIDQTYRSEIARIDEVFGVSQGWLKTVNSCKRSCGVPISCGTPGRDCRSLGFPTSRPPRSAWAPIGGRWRNGPSVARRKRTP